MQIKMSSKTSLARQLGRLKTPQTSLFVSSRVRESFLYDAKQAATIDLDTHYSIALSGLNELAAIDARCNDYQASLFKETSKSLDRSTLSREENAELNEEIEQFLCRVVSPYFLMTATHKVIEWLVIKYHIHQFNADELLFAVLPYHETRYFTRLVQICQLERSNYAWLAQLKKTGSILVKTMLHDHLDQHTELLRAFSDRLFANIKRDYDVTLWISFFTSTIISILEKNGITDRNGKDENKVSFTIHYINQCFKVANGAFTMSAYLVLTYLATRAQLDESKLKKILSKMESNFRQLTGNGCVAPKNEFVYCLSTICQHQALNSLSNKITDLLLAERLYTECDLKSPHLLSAIVNNLVARLGEDSATADQIAELLGTVQPEHFVVNSLVQRIVEHCDEDEQMFAACTELMKLIERRYPNQFDRSIEALPQEAVSKILHSSVYLRLDEGNIKLVNAINHPNSKIRLASLDLLRELENYELLDVNSKETIRDAVSAMLVEQDRKILLKLLEVRCLEKIVGADQLAASGVTLFAKCSRKIAGNDSKSESWAKIQTKFFHLLLQLDYGEEQFLSVFSRYLFPCSANDLTLFHELLKCEKMQKIQFIAHLNTSIKKKEKHLLRALFNSSADYVLANGRSFIDSLTGRNHHNAICALAIDSILLERCTTFEQVNECVNRSVSTLNRLLVKSNAGLDPNASSKASQESTTKTSSKASSKASQESTTETFSLINLMEDNNNYEEFDLFERQLQAIDSRQIIVEFVCLVIEKLIGTIVCSKLVESDDFYVNSLFGLLCDLINTKATRRPEFRTLFASFIDKCDRTFNYEYFISMWINQQRPQLQARSLAICVQTLKNHQLSESGTLHLLVALSSPSIDIRRLALNVLLAVNLNSNDLISLAAKNSNDQLISNGAISKVLAKSDAKKRKQFLGLAAKQLENWTESLNLTHGLLALLSKDFTAGLLNSLNRIAGDLLTRKEQLTTKENEILALVFALYLNFFGDEKNLQLGNYKAAIQHFCQIIERPPPIREFVYAKLKKRWILGLKSNSLIVAITHTFLNDFIATGSEQTKCKLINFLNDGKVVSYLINTYTLSPSSSAKTSENTTKKQPVEERLPFDVDNVNWKKVLILLEITQSKNEIANSTILLKCLFVLLRECLRVDERPSVEYLKQLVLYNVHNCLEQPDCDVAHFEIDLLFSLMNCLRLKASQTAVLTILNLVTPHFKQEILNNFMLIFTYIGSNMMDFNGQHEMKLVDDTLDSIIPCLIDENEQIKNQITDAFIDALADIPSHRLVHIFSRLIRLYRAENSLWYVLFKLNIRTVRESLFEETDFLDFTQSLTGRFDCTANLNTMVNITVTNSKILDNQFTFGADTITRKESAKLNLLLAKQLNAVLDSDGFLSQIANASWEEVNLDFKNLVEQLILLIVKLEAIAPSERSETHEQLHEIVYETLNKLNNLLPLEEFSDILQHLLNNGLQAIYQKTLKVFIKKLSSTGQFNISNECWLNFFASLTTIIERCVPDESSRPAESSQPDEQTLITGQYAFVGLKVIAKHLEQRDDLHGELIKAIQATLAVTERLDLEQPKVFNLFVSGVLCLGKLACVIKQQAIGYISAIVQLILKAFARNTDIVNLSCFAVLAKLTKIFPTYLGAFLPDILMRVCSLARRRAKLAELNAKCSIVEKNIVTLVPFRKLIEILITTHKHLAVGAESNNYESLAYFLKFAESAFKPLKLATIDENIAQINKFIFKLVEHRAENAKRLSGDCLNRLEAGSLSIICAFLPKLKESKFKLFVIRLYDWATSAAAGASHRLQTFYSLTNRLADSVKVMFPIAVTPIIAPNCLQMLSKETMDDPAIADEQKHSIVLNVLRTISKSIHYNVRSVLSSKDIERFVDPIVEQIDQAFGTPSMYEQRIRDGVAACVSDLVKHFNDFQLAKSLQVKILEKTKLKNRTKRYQALYVLNQFILANTEEYVTYLPDAVPYLVELYEDDSEEIQTLLLSTFRSVEQLINEPISNYL